MWKRHRHNDCIKEALTHAERVCKERKSKFTPLRKKVFELIWKSHKPIKAYDILAQLSSEDYIEKPPTVYRTLDFLQNNQLIHRIESKNAYIGCSIKHQSFDSKFFICDKCNEVEELVETKVNKSLISASKKHGFHPSIMNVEIHGTCAQCMH